MNYNISKQIFSLFIVYNVNLELIIYIYEETNLIVPLIFASRTLVVEFIFVAFDILAYQIIPFNTWLDILMP